MARSKRRGRRKKITYDSSETKIVFGLLVLFAGIVALLSQFTEGILFAHFTRLFGESVILVSCTLFILSSYLFGILPERITLRSVIGGTLVTLAYATYISSGINLPVNITELGAQGQFGGVVGVTLAEQLAAYLFQDMVRPLMILIIFFSLPLVFSISLTDYFSFIRKIILSITNFFNKVFNSFDVNRAV